MSTLRLSALVLALAASVPVTAAAARRAAAPKAAGDAKATAAPAAGATPEMAAWMKAATPGEAHAVLARMAGHFEVESRFFAGPGAEPQISRGTADQTMIFGGRYLRQDFTGEMAGQPFQGLGFIGYDNVRKKYFSYWIDAMSTMPLTHEGVCADKGCTTLELEGQYLDPLSGKKKKSRTTTAIGADGRLVYTMFDQDKAGRAFKSLELVYTRK